MGNTNAKEARSPGGTTTASSSSFSGRRRERANTVPAYPRSRRSKRKDSTTDDKDADNEIPHLIRVIWLTGVLAPHGVYSGKPNYKYPIVRQLMIDRRLAPFFKGLSDYEEDWSDRQMIAAVRGLPVHDPESEEEEDEDEELQEIWRLKAEAEHLESTSRVNNPTSDSPLEVKLYREAVECPICFLFYPKWLNSTRCCLQSICSECFVQIKRADPHPPYHLEEEEGEEEEQGTKSEESSELVSEPACCPYCTAPDFGVVYYPPPFRNGLNTTLASGSAANQQQRRERSGAVTATTTTTTAATGISSAGESATRARKGSLPPSAAEVVTIDQIRPDWVQILHNARRHQARRSAAANALHATAFLQSNSNSNSEEASSRSQGHHRRLRGFSNRENRRGNNNNNRSNAQGIEDMMLVEAIRLSMYDEEMRRKKEQESSQR